MQASNWMAFLLLKVTSAFHADDIIVTVKDLIETLGNKEAAATWYLCTSELRNSVKCVSACMGEIHTSKMYI